MGKLAYITKLGVLRLPRNYYIRDLRLLVLVISLRILREALVVKSRRALYLNRIGYKGRSLSLARASLNILCYY